MRAPETFGLVRCVPDAPMRTLNSMLRPAGATWGAGGIRAALRLLRAPRLIAIVALTGAIAMPCGMAWAHSHVDERAKIDWYPVECCHDGDCRPAERLKSPQEVNGSEPYTA